MFAQASDLSAFHIHSREYIRNTFLSFLLNFLDVLELKLLMQRTQLGPNANLASQLTIVFHKVELA